MSESYKFDSYKKKLQGICDENNLIFRFRSDTYPITLTIRPVGGVAAQMSMLEDAEEKGYTSPEAAIVFIYKDGELTYETSETFTISDALFSKIKNLFKNMHYLWLQYFFREVTEKLQNGALNIQDLPRIDEGEYTPGATGSLTEKQLTGGEPIEGLEPLEVDDIPSLEDDDVEGIDDIEDEAPPEESYEYEGSEPYADQS